MIQELLIPSEFNHINITGKSNEPLNNAGDAFGFVEPELSEQEYEEFGQRLDELNSKYEILYGGSEFGGSEFGGDEEYCE